MSGDGQMYESFRVALMITCRVVEWMKRTTVLYFELAGQTGRISGRLSGKMILC